MHGTRICYLPPYSPDLMLCEGVFSQVKSIIKENHNLFDSCSCPRAILALAFSMVAVEDCKGQISHCEYDITGNLRPGSD
jgi:transposase